MRWFRARREREAEREPTEAPVRLFVGRKKEAAELRDGIVGVTHGLPAIILLEGPAGSGKESLVHEARQQVLEQIPEAAFVEIFCYRATGTQDPFGPLTEALYRLVQNEKRPLARDALEVIRENGPELLSLIPGIGSTLSAAAKLGGGIATRALSRDDAEMVARWESLPARFEDTLIALARKRPPLTLVIKDANWIDPRSTEVLVRLARHEAGCPLAVVLTIPIPIADDHPLREISDRVSTIQMQPLSLDEIDEYIRARYGLPISDELAPWLLLRSKGLPQFVEEYLEMLEAENVIQLRDGRYELAASLSLVDRRLPRDTAQVLRQRISEVDTDTRRLLEVSAVQGQQFLAATVADIMGTEELEVVLRLEEIERSHRLLSFAVVERLADARTALYTFESGIQQTLYEGVSRYRQLVLHHRIAESLERYFGLDDASRQSPRKWVLETARHFEEAEEPLRAAARYLQAGQSAFADGGFAEAVSACDAALVLVRELPTDVEENDRLRAEVIQLWLDAMASWEPETVPGQNAERLAMADEAEAAAVRVRDMRLQAMIRYARAKVIFRDGRLDNALAAFGEALGLAETSGDPLAQLVILSDFGHHMNSKDLARGRDLLRRAYTLYESGTITVASPSESRLLTRRGARLKGLIGIAEFDLGNLGEADRWLEESVADQADEGHDNRAMTLNFRGQLMTAMGSFELAITAFERALAVSREMATTASAYHLALLAKVYLEWDGQVAVAEPLLKEAASMAEGVNDQPLLVDHVRAESLLIRGSPGDLEQAEALLTSSQTRADVIGSIRAGIAARVLMARLALIRGVADAAVASSTDAAARLARQGGAVPTVRSEEVLFTHHRALSAVGRLPESAAALHEAERVLDAKAGSILNSEDRQTFLVRVAVNRDIKAAAQRAGAERTTLT